ncbi:MAG: hypothetical protein AAF329_29225 [Cyanobacteria bacterium P01_A01_bin.17]
MAGLIASGLSAVTLLHSPASWGQDPFPEIELQPSETESQLPTAPASAADLIPLNPDPKLLDVPKTEEQVTIDLDQPITLEQALELAQRNNRDVQVAELEL